MNAINVWRSPLAKFIVVAGSIIAGLIFISGCQDAQNPLLGDINQTGDGTINIDTNVNSGDVNAGGDGEVNVGTAKPCGGDCPDTIVPPSTTRPPTTGGSGYILPDNDSPRMGIVESYKNFFRIISN